MNTPTLATNIKSAKPSMATSFRLLAFLIGVPDIPLPAGVAVTELIAGSTGVAPKAP